jgi:hypothetical protein
MNASTGGGFSAVPLPNAMFCLDCETISSSLNHICTVCGSHALISLCRMLGGTLRSQQAESTEEHAKAAKYSLEINCKVHEIPATGLNLLIELLTRLAEVGGAVESLHINAESVFDNQGVRRAA